MELFDPLGFHQVPENNAQQLSKSLVETYVFCGS